MAEERKTPRIRFPGFTDDWEQRKFSDVFEYLQNNTLSRADLTVEDGVAKNVHYGDVLIKYGEYLDASDATLPFIQSKQLVDKLRNSLLKDGDVIMADTAEDETVGKCTEIAGLQGFPTVSGLHTIPLRPKQKFAPGYLGYYMNSGAYHDQLLPLMQGIKVTSISKSAVANTDIVFPVDSDEQASIGGLFIRLDNLITLHQHKCDDLRKMKLGMLQKMFPKEGESVPEIRFPGFTDDWEQRKLGDITERIIVGLATSVTPYYRDKGTPLLRNMNIKENYLDDSDILYLDEEYADSNESKKIHTDDVLTVHTGANIGLTCLAPAQYDGCLSFTTLITTPQKEVLDSGFLMQYMNSTKGKNGINSIITAGGKPNLNSGDLEKLEVYYPSFSEQKLISSFLLNLDNLITLHQRKCDELKHMKKSLLQQMFI